MKTILGIIGLLLVHSICVSAQAPPPVDTSSGQQQIRSEQATEQQSSSRQPNSPKRVSDYAALKNNGNRNGGLMRRLSLPFKMSLNKEQRKRLAPDEQLASRYASFLEQPRTGLIKLYSDMGCEENANILRADEACLEWIPNSAFYSFREKEHTSDFLSDIMYKNGFLVSDGILSQGIMAALGDVLLENVTLSTGGMKFLVDYKPEPESQRALQQFLEISRGVKSGNYLYRKAFKAVENMTYAFRVIAYRSKYISVYRGWRFDALYGDKRIDLILALRVVRKEENGNVTLLWKELSRQDAPRLIIPKRDKKKAN